MSLWNDDPYYVGDPDERPYGWGLCCECSTDCEEDDYDENRRRSTCAACRARQAQSAEERLAHEVFARR